MAASETLDPVTGQPVVGTAGAPGAGASSTGGQAPAVDFGPFKDSAGLLTGYKELQRYTGDLKKQMDRLEAELEAVRGAEEKPPADEPQGPQASLAEFVKDPDGYIQRRGGKMTEALQDKILDLKIEHARLTLKDFDKYEDEIADVLEEGIINRSHPRALAEAYGVVLRRHEGEAAAADQGEPGETPPAVETGKGKGGLGTGLTADQLANMSLEDLEKLAKSQPGAVVR